MHKARHCTVHFPFSMLITRFETIFSSTTMDPKANIRDREKNAHSCRYAISKLYLYFVVINLQLHKSRPLIWFSLTEKKCEGNQRSFTKSHGNNKPQINCAIKRTCSLLQITIVCWMRRNLFMEILLTLIMRYLYTVVQLVIILTSVRLTGRASSIHSKFKHFFSFSTRD